MRSRPSRKSATSARSARKGASASSSPLRAAPVQAAPLHPNPQFARPNWRPLSGTWDFALDPEARWHVPDEIEWDQRIEVPFSPETPASGVGYPDFFLACWYRRSFDVGPLAPGRRLLLHFGAVDYQAVVWVNGHVVGMHEGGYTSFVCDITPVVTPGQEAVVVVQAMDDPHDLCKPRGKQDWQRDPHSIWYPRTSGIWQPVWLEETGASYLAKVTWTPDLERFEIGLLAHVARPTDGLTLHLRLSNDRHVLADDAYSVTAGQVHRAVALADPGIDDYRNELLWSPDRPTLIQARLTLEDGQGQVLDELHSYTAMRGVSVLGERFMLNGRPHYLRLVLDQGYWPDSGLTPPSDDAARRDVELVREMGFNGVRAHQRIPDPRYLYWADRLGLLVWEEMPSPYRFATATVVRLTQQWSEVIERDRSHPCVIAWVPMNESWGVPDLPTNPAHRETVRLMYHLTKALDPTRPVIGNDGWEMNVTDIVAIHDYERSAERLRNRYQAREDPRQMLSLERPGHRVLLLSEEAYHGQPIMLTEFGGIALREKGSWGYAEVDSPADLARRYGELLAAVHDLPLFAGFCYTQFADTYQEANGLLRADRTPKFDLAAMSKATRGPA